MKTVAPSSHQTIQRVKVGMVGLAAVILLIGLASAIFSAADRGRTGGAGAGNVAVAAKLPDNAADPANEPLAELGVAPSADVNGAAPAGKR